MAQSMVEQLKKINWFDKLPDDMLAALAQKVRRHTLRRDEILFHKGDVGDSLFIILSGRVKVFSHDDQGEEVALNQVDAGEVIGEMALLDYEPRSASVVALEKTATLELSREDFMEIMEREPALALSVIRNLSARLRQNTTYIEQITDMSRRVAKGDYAFINGTQSLPASQAEVRIEQDKVGQLMEEFIAMVREIREREEELKKQVRKLSLQIDEAKRKQRVDEITNSEFYATLKEQAQKLRSQRLDNK